ncbi:MAG: hypothetical protein AAGC78_09135 [Cellvibrio sp.]|uniref:hypothetical protein n=1 Tax=Cellvibrio sp. TaxID=1965322 RepID=UPI0031B17811
MTSIKLRWIQIQTEWQANKRLQVISVAAFILFILWAHVQLDHWRVAKKEEVVSAASRYQDTLAVANDDAWVARAKEADEYRQNVKTKLWEATSEGEAEAKLRDWLQKQAEVVGLSITRITVEVGVPPRGLQYRPVHVDIQGVYKAGSWQVFLQALGSSTPPVVVDLEQLNVVNPQNLFYRLNLTAWFNINTPSESK